MKRRDFLKAGVAGIASAAFTAQSSPASSATGVAPLTRRVRPSDPNWPSAQEWEGLRKSLTGRLEKVTTPLETVLAKTKGKLTPGAVKTLTNPFFIQDVSGGTQSTGWSDGWISSPSVHVVIPENAADIAEAVKFARAKNLRLVVKGGAHSYLGQSNAPDSLMIWTKKLDSLKLHDDFVPAGCAGSVKPVQAVSVGAGAKFIQLYDFVVTKNGRYVQGGGCTSVGVGGHMQTGGFGSYSKFGGLTAAGLLEAEIVTADGRVLVVNACQNADLFWALKGGGAGWGITTRLTLATHPLPKTLGFMSQTFKAESDESYRKLIKAFLDFSRDALINPHWGEQVSFGPDNTLAVFMGFQGLDEAQAREVWKPFWAWVQDNAKDVRETERLRMLAIPARHWWDFEYRKKNMPKSIVIDDRPGAAPGRFWWAGNGSEVGIFISNYESAWLPQSLLAPTQVDALAQGLFDASRHYLTTLHYNKGLAGAPAERIKEARDTAVHPGVLDAFALVIIAGGQTKVYPGVLGHEPRRDEARAEGKKISAAFEAVRRLAPDAGSYSSEMGYHAENWREAAWGPHYPRLLQIKQKYDPDGLFTGHHQVGSEFWSKDGFTKL